MTPLRRRMLEDLQVRSLSVHTQRSYLEQVSRFARHFDKSAAELGPEEIRAYGIDSVILCCSPTARSRPTRPRQVPSIATSARADQGEGPADTGTAAR